jgi:hypothetical protein
MVAFEEPPDFPPILFAPSDQTTDELQTVRKSIQGILAIELASTINVGYPTPARPHPIGFLKDTADSYESRPVLSSKTEVEFSTHRQWLQFHA